MKMPFGKYKGEWVEDLPESYLLWLIENVSLREPLRAAVWEALEGQGPEPDFLPQPQTVKSIYRRLSLKYHPDRGGSTEAQQALNEFYEALTEKILS
jgi:preprotein translocase subunit Sec63